MGHADSRKKEYLRDFLILIFLVFGVFLYFKIRDWTANEKSGFINSFEDTRTYLLYVPDSYNHREPAPLVIALHGYGSKPSDIQFTSRWNELADKEGFLVAYPAADFSPKRWRASASISSMEDPQRDVQFISDLIDNLEVKYNINPDRIYVNGISQGGGMTYVIACGLADRVAAVGSVAGAYSYPLEQCAPSRPIPVIAFHGDADAIVPYHGGGYGGYNISFLPAPSWAVWWAEHNQCAASKAVAQASEINRTDYQDCSQGAEVVFYTIQGGGHTWPGDPSSTDSPEWGYTTHQIDATRLMWEFFNAHPLRTP